MPFKEFFINATSDLHQLQNTINEGISVCNHYLESGGNPTFNASIYLRSIRQSIIEVIQKRVHYQTIMTLKKRIKTIVASAF